MKITKNLSTVLIYSLSTIFIFVALTYISRFASLKDFIQGVEAKTFDLRQNIISKYKKANKDILIITVDNESYNYIVDTYGDWPPKREIWADLINNVNKYSPKLIIFDLLFPKRFEAQKSSDDKFIKTVNENENVIVAMDFDNSSYELRTPPVLPLALQNEITKSDIIKNNPSLNYTNCRTIMPEILNGTNNIGFVNFTRDKDGIIRYMPIFYRYNGKYYKHLTIKSALKYLGIDKNSFEIKNNDLILSDNYKIPLDYSGRAILNWYGIEQSFEHLPLWKINKLIKSGNQNLLKETLENKIIYVATTATALSDVKSSPLSYKTAGVEMHATLFNNILDQNFIKRISPVANGIISLLVCIIVGIIVFKVNNVAISVFESLGVLFIYFLLSIISMQYFNIWIDTVLPITLGILIFIAGYIIKYFMTSKNYEETYKLAITDGLTGLFNHRYFQEQLMLNVQNYLRYKTPCSLILIDIDFFKKFNDTYGHQSGDAVLRQVAQMIKKCIRQTDIACRYGGEEMSIILTNTKKSEAIITAKKVCETIRQTPVTLAQGGVAQVTISVGVATASSKENTPKKIIEYCDKCLYSAKENGRDRVVSKI